MSQFKPKPAVDKSKIDVSACFMIYVACLGDIERVALAMDLAPEVVRALAESENWISKVRKASLMAKSDEPHAYERAVNRGIQFLQGHAIRSVVQRILDVLSKQDGNELLASLAQTKAGQVQYSAKFLAELSQAAERGNHLCLNALGDTLSEREEGDDGEGKVNLAGVHSAVLAALNSPIAIGAERRILEQNVEDIVKKNMPERPDTND